MRARSMAVVGMVIASLTALAGTGSALSTVDVQDTAYETINDTDTSLLPSLSTSIALPSNVTDTIGALADETCTFGLAILATQGWGVPANRDEFGYEDDQMSGPCKDFRDALTHRVWQGQDPPYIEYCNYAVGMHCVAVGHYACDFALVVDGGLVYMCEGGLTPYN